MNNELINFHHEMFGDIRAIEKDGEPWFVGKDVAEALGYSNASKAVMVHVDEEDKQKVMLKADSQNGNVVTATTLINESGLYSLVLSSKLPQAKVFKHWVTAEVLPSIRRHGAYATAPTIEKIIASPEFGIALLKNLQQEQLMRREAEQRVRKLQPLADYTALILACPETVSVSQVAQDYGMSAVAFNRILNRAGIQYSVGGQWVLNAAYKDRGLVQSYTFNYRHNDDTDGCRMYTRWTQRGRLFLYDILKKIGIIPMIEKNK
jgi:prophage antirepressor-like protein